MYNRNKGGVPVDTLDEKCSKSSTSRRTRRWPLVIFFRMLDESIVHSFIIHQAFKDNEVISDKSVFAKHLASELVQEHMERRLTNPRIPREIRSIIRRILKIPEESEVPNEELVLQKHESQAGIEKQNDEPHRQLRRFFDSLLKLESHYCRKDSSKFYLEPLWTSKSQLYKLYKDDFCPREKAEPLRITSFCNVFEDLNLSLFRPKKDLCDICESFKTENINEYEYRIHVGMKKEARAQLLKDSTSNNEVFTMDLQSVLLSPRSKCQLFTIKQNSLYTTLPYMMFHLANNEECPPNDRLHKIRCLIDMLNENFHRCIVPEESLCIDETMRRFEANCPSDST
nr:unnamed protein product [Callosobruchus chinensis]